MQIRGPIRVVRLLMLFRPCSEVVSGYLGSKFNFILPIYQADEILLCPCRRIRTTTQNVNSNLTMEGGGKDDSGFGGAALPSLLQEEEEEEEEEAISQLLPSSVMSQSFINCLPTYCLCVGSGILRRGKDSRRECQNCII